MNKEIEKSLKNIFNTLTAKSDKEIALLIEETVNIIHENKSKLSLDDPERFNSLINYKINRAIKLITETLHNPSISRDKNKPNFIYANYGFLERNIRELCVLREGSSCCADKSRYILKMFLKYSIDGEIPSFDPNLKGYYIPNFGDNKMWIDYCDSLYSLYYGETESYFKAYNDLLQCEKRKFKHLLHKWYVELDDGDIIAIGQSWDKDLDSPLDDYTDKGDYHIIHKRFVKNKNFEVYVSEDEEESFLCGRNYVKLPKSLIKNIYYETEEHML